MSLRLRPQLERLEEIAVPASLSYQLSDGTTGSGLFSTPDGVDPAQPYQSLPLDDLTVTQGGVAFAVQIGATAEYQRGSLVGVNATATSGSDTLQFANYMVVLNGQDYGNIVYDAADTRDTFQFADGTTGVLSYTIPWNQVDSAQANQSLTPQTFNLNIAGQNFASGSAYYTQQPTLVFSYGDFVGVTFGLTPPSFAYTSLTASFDANGNNIITAIQAVTGTQFIAAPRPQQLVDFDFANATQGKPYDITLSFRDGSGKEIVSITVHVQATDGASDIAHKVTDAAVATGKLQVSGDGHSEVKMSANKNSRGWEKLEITLADLFGQPDPTLLGPTLLRRDVVIVAGDYQKPNQ